MGVIGVVAALTLPNLNQSTNNKEKVAKLQKIYSNLNDAYGRATAVYGPIDEWGLTSDHQTSCKKAAGRITEFMKISKDCGYQSNCFVAAKVNNLDGTVSDLIPNVGYDYILADGTAISIDVYVDGVGIDVDLDGPNKGRHQLGTDHFYFSLDFDKKEDGFIPDSQDNVAACIGSNGALCTAWVIQNGNMDYINAASNGKCNNSNITLSATNITCK